MDNRTFNFTIYCRIDKQVLKYELHLDLWSDIDPSNSTVQLSSVGRAMVYLDKPKKPERWRRLTKSSEVLPNQKTWWDMFEKYEEELLKHTTFETDDAMEQFVHIGDTPKKKKRPQKPRKPKRMPGENAVGEKKEEL